MLHFDVDDDLDLHIFEIADNEVTVVLQKQTRIVEKVPVRDFYLLIKQFAPIRVAVDGEL
jgi:hypothetical protein